MGRRGCMREEGGEWASSVLAKKGGGGSVRTRVVCSEWGWWVQCGGFFSVWGL